MGPPGGSQQAPPHLTIPTDGSLSPSQAALHLALLLSTWGCRGMSGHQEEIISLPSQRIDTYVLHAFDLIITITGTCRWKHPADMTLEDTGKESTE